MEHLPVGLLQDTTVDFKLQRQLDRQRLRDIKRTLRAEKKATRCRSSDMETPEAKVIRKEIRRQEREDRKAARALKRFERNALRLESDVRADKAIRNMERRRAKEGMGSKTEPIAPHPTADDTKKMYRRIAQEALQQQELSNGGLIPKVTDYPTTIPLIVDIYNISSCDPIARQQMRRSRTAATQYYMDEKLIPRMNLPGSGGIADGRVVFAANDYGHRNVEEVMSTPQPFPTSCVCKVYSGRESNADDMIVSMVSQFQVPPCGGPKAVVVTSDRELMGRILEVGGVVIKSGMFDRYLNELSHP
eukprot:PhF_6_TR25083/c0_g1_i1/m.34422